MLFLICPCYCLTVLLAFWHNCCLLVFSLALKPVFSSRSLRPQIWIQATSFWGVTLSSPSWSTEVGSKWCVFGLSKLIPASLTWSDIQVFPVWKVPLHCSDTRVMTLYTGVMFNVHALLRLLWKLVSGSCFLWVSTSWLGFDSPHWVTLLSRHFCHSQTLEHPLLDCWLSTGTLLTALGFFSMLALLRWTLCFNLSHYGYFLPSVDMYLDDRLD